MKKLLIIFSFLSFTLFSCEKDTIDYPVTFSTKTVSEYSLRIFTTDGEITSESLKYDIVQRYKYQLNAVSNEDLKGKIVCTYITKDSVEIIIDGVKEAKPRNVLENNGLVYWEKQDTTVKGYTWLPYDILKAQEYIPTYYLETPCASGSAYKILVESKECLYAIKNKGKLSIPMFDFFINYSGYLVKEINNSFKNLEERAFNHKDTIIIQEYLIDMEIL